MQTLTRPRTVTLREDVLGRPTGRVDRAAGVIFGVRVLGRRSRNGREYSDRALREAAQHYAGVAVRIDHPDRGRPNAERKFQEHFGCLRNPIVGSDAVHADLHYVRSHPLAEMVCESAERMPHTFGLSHNAEGQTTTRGGKVIVESIVRVRSVDIVCNPATTSGLFESLGRRGPLVEDAEAMTAEIDALVLAAFHDEGLTPKELTARLTELRDVSERLQAIRREHAPGAPQSKAAKERRAESEDKDDQTREAFDKYRKTIATTEQFAESLKGNHRPPPPAAAIRRFAESLRGH